jgi:hypothetical protein
MGYVLHSADFILEYQDKRKRFGSIMKNSFKKKVHLAIKG